MERHAFAMKVKEGKMNDYRKTLGEIWPELTAYLDRNGIHNFSIWNAADLIFGYYENADGAVISPEEEKVKAALKDAVVIDKPTFGSKILAEEITKIAEKEDITVTLVGLCTDICVVSNALLIKAYLPEIPVKVIASCCAGVTTESHEAALATMRMCQVQVE